MRFRLDKAGSHRPGKLSPGSTSCNMPQTPGGRCMEKASTLPNAPRRPVMFPQFSAFPKILRAKAPEGSWRLLKAPEGSWRLLKAPEGSWRLLKAPEGSWRLLKAPEGSWRLLKAPEGSWRLLKAAWMSAALYLEGRRVLCWRCRRLLLDASLPCCSRDGHGLQGACNWKHLEFIY